MAEARKDGCELRPGTAGSAGFLVSDGKVCSYYSHSIQYTIATLQIKVCTGWMLVRFWCPRNDVRL